MQPPKFQITDSHWLDIVLTKLTELSRDAQCCATVLRKGEATWNVSVEPLTPWLRSAEQGLFLVISAISWLTLDGHVSVDNGLELSTNVAIWGMGVTDSIKCCICITWFGKTVDKTQVSFTDVLTISSREGQDGHCPHGSNSNRSILIATVFLSDYKIWTIKFLYFRVTLGAKEVLQS